MKLFHRISVATLAIASAVSFLGPMAAFAATSPTLAGASTYSVVSGTTVTNTGATTISGNVGISPAGGGGYAESGTTTYGVGSSLHNADGAAAAAQADNTATFTALDAVPNVACDTDYGAITKELSGLSLPPGIYCADAFHLTGTLTLNDTGAPNGVWIFRSVLSTLVTSAGVGAKVQFLTGTGLACNVWWKVASSATIGSGTAFIGNILALTSVTMSTGATLNGRAMAQTGAVTLDTNTISGPTCAQAPQGGGSANEATLNVLKTVINDNGGTKTVSDFPLFANNTPVVSGVTIILPSNGAYTVTETYDPTKYKQSFSGDCDATGRLILNTNDHKFCLVTNNDIGVPVIVPPIPPLIDIVKVPSPLALPNGPGQVTYTYTVRNVGTVPMTNVTVVDDSCGPVSLVSGDTNSDQKLDVTETWTYHCYSNLTATHTNTVVATGIANGISASDIATATVVVGSPVVPPLIHVTKVPSPLALLAGGGMVTYTEKISNPGVVALSNVQLTDDKCAPMKYISGDTNADAKLDPSETWTYTCRSNLKVTTTNTAVATGQANGYTVRDFAIATVVVASAPPKLPNTGLFTEEKNTSWILAILASISSAAVLLYVARKKQSV